MNRFIIDENNNTMKQTYKYNKWLLEKFVSYFFIYGILFWILEEIFCLFVYKDFSNRGLLFLPILPLYGFSSIIISIVFKNEDSFSLYIYFFSVILIIILQSIVSFICTNLFGVSFNDYNGINISLKGFKVPIFPLISGIAFVIIIKMINPLIDSKIKKYKCTNKIEIVLSILCIITLLDYIVSITCLIR